MIINLTGYEVEHTVYNEYDRSYILSIGLDVNVSHYKYRQEILKIAKRYKKWYHFFKPRARVLISKDPLLARELAQVGFRPVTCNM